ncbi:MAG: hypothetical protein JW818_03095 [Pirellulales bacterium]|nr:hypothetical protein [Pirellulales bacterium]
MLRLFTLLIIMLAASTIFGCGNKATTPLPTVKTSASKPDPSKAAAAFAGRLVAIWEKEGVSLTSSEMKPQGPLQHKIGRLVDLKTHADDAIEHINRQVKLPRNVERRIRAEPNMQLRLFDNVYITGPPEGWTDEEVWTLTITEAQSAKAEADRDCAFLLFGHRDGQWQVLSGCHRAEDSYTAMSFPFMARLRELTRQCQDASSGKDE